MKSIIHALTDRVCDLFTKAIGYMHRLKWKWQLDRSLAHEAAYVKAVAEYDAAILCATMGGRDTSALEVSRNIYSDMLELEREYQRYIYRVLLNSAALPVLES